MYQEAEKRLSALINSGIPDALCGGSTGLEKESLRVGPDGSIAQTPHPAALGSALTHPWITTDYSEALLEFITPPYTELADTLGFLRLLQHYVYLHLDKELLWSASMPCVVEGESFIPLARYGNSNAGTMKTVYRRGLGHRYGRAMQAIAGIHMYQRMSLRPIRSPSQPPRNVPSPPAMPMMSPRAVPASPELMPWVRIRKAGIQAMAP